MVDWVECSRASHKAVAGRVSLLLEPLSFTHHPCRLESFPIRHRLPSLFLLLLLSSSLSSSPAAGLAVHRTNLTKRFRNTFLPWEYRSSVMPSCIWTLDEVGH
jgi:hypothetical protein